MKKDEKENNKLPIAVFVSHKDKKQLCDYKEIFLKIILERIE